MPRPNKPILEWTILFFMTIMIWEIFTATQRNKSVRPPNVTPWQSGMPETKEIGIRKVPGASSTDITFY